MTFTTITKMISMIPTKPIMRKITTIMIVTNKENLSDGVDSVGDSSVGPTSTHNFTDYV